jgi:hypothetical protein
VKRSRCATAAVLPAIAGDRPRQNVLARRQRALLVSSVIVFLGIALNGCSRLGPEPVALDQDPGSNGAPTALGD